MPRKATLTKTRYEIRFDARTEKRIQRRADARGQNFTETMRQLIRDGLDAQTK